MNTVASQVTLFTDPTVKCVGPHDLQHSGPTLYEWGRDADGFRLGEKDYATRSQHGLYLIWAFNEIRRRSKSESIVGSVEIEIKEHRAEAVRLDNEAGTTGDDCKQALELVRMKPSGISRLLLKGLSAVILTQGHVSRELNIEQQLDVEHGQQYLQTRYFPPGNPADINFDTIGHDEVVFLRGLGLVFFDYVILLTARRGGWFERQADGRFKYHPTGFEPQIYASSRGGIPYLTKGDDQKTATDVFEPKYLTKEALATLKDAKEIKFDDDVWPLISKEVKFVYYKALFREEGKQVDDKTLADIIQPDESDEKDLRQWATPDSFWSCWLLEHLQKDVLEAKKGNVQGPQKAAIDVLREIRESLREIISFGNSERGTWKSFTKLNAFLSTGPPRRRVEQLIALMEAGVLHVLGPNSEVEREGDHWKVTSKNPKFVLETKTLVDALIPEPSLEHTADSLLKYMYGKGECRAHEIHGYKTGAIDIASETYNIIKDSKKPHPRRFAIGVPAEGLHWFTTIQPRPGADSINLRQTDAIAQAVLRLAERDHLEKDSAGSWAGSWAVPDELEPAPSHPNKANLRVFLEPKDHSVEGHTSTCTLYFNDQVIWGPSSCHGNATQIRDALQAADPRFTLKIMPKAKTIEGHAVTISVIRGDKLYLHRLSTHDNMSGLCDAINRCVGNMDG
ncbi:hypothetical protein C7974DRAFT_406401 [Boeremia exigua]|uniref:uncharacterized protein n=1 Tax=Boeremia exigua TaxID=749465 RepID=UPI001E8D8F8D|nr:uncharacterized protein C7974DRAFT_406401 [Boeremia exigua]KAH6611847.1 hypothetical protein C7974DRAFT_406401 [Boeremia exigua]